MCIRDRQLCTTSTIVGFYLSGILSLSQVQSSASLVSPVRLHHYFHLSVAKAGLLFATVAFDCGSTVFMQGLRRDTDKAAFVSTRQLGHAGPVQCNLNSSIFWSVIHPFFLVTLSRSSSCFVSRQLVAPPPIRVLRERERRCLPTEFAFWKPGTPAWAQDWTHDSKMPRFVDKCSTTCATEADSWTIILPKQIKYHRAKETKKKDKSVELGSARIGFY